MSARRFAPPVPCRRARRALGRRLHRCRHVQKRCPCRLRHRCFRPQMRRRTGQRRTPAGTVHDPPGPAVRERCPGKGTGLVHRADSHRHYLSIKDTECLAGTGIEPAVGSVGDGHGGALAATIEGPFEAQALHRRGPWRSFAAVECATLRWALRLSDRRPMEPAGNIAPAETGAGFCAGAETEPIAAALTKTSLRQVRRGSQRRRYPDGPDRVRRCSSRSMIRGGTQALRQARCTRHAPDKCLRSRNRALRRVRRSAAARKASSAPSRNTASGQASP